MTPTGNGVKRADPNEGRPGGRSFGLTNIFARTLGGVVSDHPLASFMYAISLSHCMTVSLALDGEGLGAMWGEEKALEMFADAGFTNVDVAQVEGDVFNNF